MPYEPIRALDSHQMVDGAFYSRERNVWVRSSDGQATQLTDDGNEDVFYDLRQINKSWWSSDNTRFAALTI